MDDKATATIARNLFPGIDRFLTYDAAGPGERVIALWAATDGAGWLHRFTGIAREGNSTYIEYSITRDGEARHFERMVLGPTTDINNPDYGKIDTFQVSRSGSDLVLSILGHRTAGGLSHVEVFSEVWRHFPEVDGQQHFPDVPNTHVFYPFIEALRRAEVVKGHNSGLFGVDEPVSRGQAAKIVVLAVEHD